jgi:hypothetical protein
MDTNRAATRGLLAALAVLLAAPAIAADVGTPTVSGLAWRSGGRDGDCLASLRGRRADVTMSFLHHDNFPEMVRYSGAGFVQRLARKAPLWVASVALVTDDHRGQFAQCATGTFDGYWRQIGANLARSGAQQVAIRLGWEANTGSHSHAWGVDNAGQIPAYKTCFRRVAGILKAASPKLLVEWTSAKKGKQDFNVLDMYPGDDVVDIVGAHYYDSGPEKSTQAVWDQYYKATYNGGPWGIGAWLDFARSRGKRLGIGEWAVWAVPDNKKPDDPVYIDNMYRFFKANAGSIAYETYFNTGGDHSLCPRTRFPAAAARYRADWGNG